MQREGLKYIWIQNDNETLLNMFLMNLWTLYLQLYYFCKNEKIPLFNWFLLCFLEIKYLKNQNQNQNNFLNIDFVERSAYLKIMQNWVILEHVFIHTMVCLNTTHFSLQFSI